MLEETKSLIRDVREQVLYLQEIGVDALGVEWKASETKQPDGNASANYPAPERTVVKESPPPDIVIPTRRAEAARADQKPAGSRMAALPSLSKRKPVERGAMIEDASVVISASKEMNAETPANDSAIDMETAISNESIESIRAEIGECTRCTLCAGRTQVVHSTGNYNAELMFIGEAPGADEDIKGEPFVGRAGQLLTKIIEAIGIKREEVFIGNINRCRPPGNRQPLPEEASVCRPYLLREVAVIKPKVIVVLGAHAAHNLLEVKTPISKLRGQFHDYFGTKVMPTFHPAYLLRDPHKKKEVWDDMKMVRDLLRTM